MSKGTTGFIAFLIGGIIVAIIGSETAIVNIIIILACIVIGLYIRFQIVSAAEEQRQFAEQQQKEARDRERRKMHAQELFAQITKYPNATNYFIKRCINNSYSSSDVQIMTDEQILTILRHKYEFEQKEKELSPEYKRQKELEEAQYLRKRKQEEAARKLREQKALEEKRRAQEIEEKRKKKEVQELPYTLPNCVSSWPLRGTIRHMYYYDYHPYYKNKDFATSDIWNTWRFIWNFKADPVKNISEREHALALNKAISLVAQTLKSTFGDKVHYLTFVCLTASTQIKTEIRFKIFSSELCSNLNMSNAYSHIHIINDASAKHEGGSGVSQKNYDGWFFNGKYVVLFDDVRTSGRSLESEKQILESFGAKVICAITLAQTV